MAQNQNIRTRYFVLSFCLSFLVLSLMLLFLLTMVPPRSESPRAREVQLELSPEAAYQPAADDAITVLFLGTSAESASPGLYLLARFDPVRGTVPILALPPETAVLNEGKEESLDEVYRYGGASYTKDRLAETLGVAIHRYVRMDKNAFIACAEAIGSVEYSLPADLTIERGGAEMVMQQGVQLLDGARAAAVISSADYGDAPARCAAVGDLTAAIVNQRIDVCESTLLDKIFETIINRIDTDISSLDFQERKTAAQYLAAQVKDPAISLTLSGAYGGDGLYRLTDTFLALVRQTYAG